MLRLAGNLTGILLPAQLHEGTHRRSIVDADRVRVSAVPSDLHIHKMRLFSSICVLIWTVVASVQAKSAAGDRLLVVLEDSADRASYSQLWHDLECRFVCTSDEDLYLPNSSKVFQNNVRITKSRVIISFEIRETNI